MILVVGGANLIAISAGTRSEVAAKKFLQSRVQPGERLELLRARSTGLIGLDWTETVDFAVIGPTTVDTVTVQAQRITGFLPRRFREPVRR